MSTAPATRYAIVTGAASGLGQALALRLARQQWTLALADVDRPGTEATLAQVRELGGAGRAVQLDVTKLDEWSLFVEQLRLDWPRLDLLINNAGVCAAGEIGSLPIEAWQRVLNVNLWGTIHGCHVCAEWLKANPGQGYVINIASVIGLLGGPTMGAYSVSKASVVALSETLRVELARYGVGVTVVCPGFFATQLLASGTFDEPAQREFAEQITRRAKITADDVASAALEAMRSRQFYLVLPRRAARLWRLKRWFPEWFLRRIEHDYRDGVPRLK